MRTFLWLAQLLLILQSSQELAAVLSGECIINLRKKENLMKSLTKILVLATALLLVLPGLGSAYSEFDPDTHTPFAPGTYDEFAFELEDTSLATVYLQTELTGTIWEYRYRVYNEAFNYWPLLGWAGPFAISQFILDNVYFDSLLSSPYGASPDTGPVAHTLVTFEFGDGGIEAGYISDVFGFVVDGRAPGATSLAQLVDGGGTVGLVIDTDDVTSVNMVLVSTDDQVKVPLSEGEGNPNIFNPGVPEPATLLLLGTGVLGLAVVVRRRRR
jgi:hypothetical protein